MKLYSSFIAGTNILDIMKVNATSHTGIYDTTVTPLIAIVDFYDFPVCLQAASWTYKHYCWNHMTSSGHYWDKRVFMNERILVIIDTAIEYNIINFSTSSSLLHHFYDSIHNSLTHSPCLHICNVNTSLHILQTVNVYCSFYRNAGILYLNKLFLYL